MDISDFYAISGKAGLFTVVASNKASVIVESVIDGKRFPTFSSQRMMALAEISVFTQEGDVPLSDIMRKIYDEHQGNQAISHKASNPEILAYFEEILPEYDKEKVYVSDMKKLISWYNLLQEKSLIKLKEAAEENEETAEENTSEPEPVEHDKEE